MSEVFTSVTKFDSSGSVEKRTTVPDGVWQVMASTDTKNRPSYYSSGGSYGYRNRGVMSGSDGDYFCTYQVVSMPGVTTQAYLHLGASAAEGAEGKYAAMTFIKLGDIES